MFHIVIDVRRIRDFGIGTYIRSLVGALARIDGENRYTLVFRSRADSELLQPGGISPRRFILARILNCFIILLFRYFYGLFTLIYTIFR